MPNQGLDYTLRGSAREHSAHKTYDQDNKSGHGQHRPSLAPSPCDPWGGHNTYRDPLGHPT